jgi:hypothetical protein
VGGTAWAVPFVFWQGREKILVCVEDYRLRQGLVGGPPRKSIRDTNNAPRKADPTGETREERLGRLVQRLFWGARERWEKPKSGDRRNAGAQMGENQEG